MRLMGELGLVDRSAAMSTPAKAYYDNSYIEEISAVGVSKRAVEVSYRLR
jgi:hypothetical protein